MPLTRRELATRLTRAQQRAGLRDADVANGVGVSKHSYQRRRNANGDGHRPGQHGIRRIAEVLGVDYEYLAGEEPHFKKTPSNGSPTRSTRSNA